MATRSYAQHCGVARALEVVGERWALLVIRDLIPWPKRFTDLRRGLPRIPTNVLSARLKELEQAGVVQRRVLPRPSGAVVYELTDYGRELEPIIVQLLLWGAKSLRDPRPEDTASASSLALGLRVAFRSEAAADLRASYELRVGDDVVVHVRIDRGELVIGEGQLPDADLTIETDLTLGALLRGELSPAEALATGAVTLTGDTELLDRFVDLFTLPRATV
jgi:DNA-binding HxlR family transcriptional regulator/putative sterol carrier protein